MTAEQMAEVPGAALRYYHAMDTKEGVFVVSNGAQTKPVLEEVVSQGVSIEEAVNSAPTVRGVINGEEKDIDLSSFEPDDPIFTPRITGVVDLRSHSRGEVGLAVVRKDLETGKPIRSFWEIDIEDLRPGWGWAIQTYDVNDPADRETPVPHFAEDPYPFQMHGDTDEVARNVRFAVGEKTFAAAVVRSIHIAKRKYNGHTITNTRG